MISAVLYAIDLKRQVDFYRALGFTCSDRVKGDYAVFDLGDADLSIVQAPQQIVDSVQIASPPEIRSSVPVKIALMVPSITAAIETVTARGGIVPEHASRWQFRDYDVHDAADPEGNVFQLREKR